jgi:predicted PurR-regulated permease PerM
MNGEMADRQEKRNGLAKRTLLIAAAAAAVIALFLLLWQVVQILMLVFASLLIALFLRTLADFLARRTPLSPGWALAAVVLVLLAGATSIILLYGPTLADSFYRFAQQLPASLDRFRSGLGQYPWGSAALDLTSRAGRSLTNPEQLSRLAGVFSTAFGALGSAVVVLVLGLYFAGDPRLYIEGAVRLVPSRHRGLAHEVFNRLGRALRWWLLGRISTMILVGLVTWLGLAVLGVQFAFVLALIAAVLDFVPNIGPIVAAVPALMVGLSQGGSTVLYVALLYLAIQALEGYLITPLIARQVVSLPPALLLVAQLVLGASVGILGVLLADPLAVVLMVLVQLLYQRNVLGEDVKLP